MYIPTSFRIIATIKHVLENEVKYKKNTGNSHLFTALVCTNKLLLLMNFGGENAANVIFVVA